MKLIIVHRRFVKQIRKLPKATIQAFKERRNLFLTDATNPLLNIHSLQGKFIGYKSFNVTADIRVIYRELDTETIIFTQIGSHSELYT